LATAGWFACFRTYADDKPLQNQEYIEDFGVFTHYSPATDGVLTLVKTGMAAGVYFIFDRLLRQSTDYKLVTSVCLYSGLMNTVGVESTDGGVGVWWLTQAYSDFRNRPLNLRQVGQILGKGGLSLVILFHQFAKFENIHTFNRSFDRFLRNPEFKWEKWSLSKVGIGELPLCKAYWRWTHF
jgi:hypothetical protein